MFKILFSIQQWLRVTISLIYLSCVALLSLLPPKDLPDVPLFPGEDKIIHALMYLGLAWLVCWAMHAESKNIWYYLVIIFSISWGIIMEIFQYLMHIGRSFEFYDIIGNSIGTLFGVFIYSLFLYIKRNNDAKMAEDGYFENLRI